jgi:hypothetical protein
LFGCWSLFVLVFLRRGAFFPRGALIGATGSSVVEGAVFPESRFFLRSLFFSRFYGFFHIVGTHS